MSKVFVEQPLALPGSANYILNKTRDIQSNKALCRREFPLALPLATSSCKELYLDVYPSSRLNVNTIYN